jgi:hypothetical protein
LGLTRIGACPVPGPTMFKAKATANRTCRMDILFSPGFDQFLAIDAVEPCPRQDTVS